MKIKSTLQSLPQGKKIQPLLISLETIIGDSGLVASFSLQYVLLVVLGDFSSWITFQPKFNAEHVVNIPGKFSIKTLIFAQYVDSINSLFLY